MVPYLIIGYDILIKAGKGIKNRQIWLRVFLMAIVTVWGDCAGGDLKWRLHGKAIAVMLCFIRLENGFQSYAVGKSRRNISDLMDIRPDYANIEFEGTLKQIDPDEVEIGSIIVVQPGEKVPIDGILLEGSSSLNTSALTGESLPVRRRSEIDYQRLY